MNRIVREHYPASKLPAELREGIDASGHVTVTVVQEEPPASREKLADLMKQALQQARSAGGVTTEEAVLRVPELRDE